MKRRHQRRTVSVLLTAVGLTAGLSTAAPALAAPKIAATGLIDTSGQTRLNTRSAPSAASARVGSAPDGMAVRIVCQTTGQRIAGTVRATSVWLRLQNGSYVSDAYIRRAPARIPSCASVPSAPRATAAAWSLPVDAPLVSGFRTQSRPNHQGIDLGAARNTPIRAVAGGTVIRVVCNVSAGSCDVDGSRNLAGCGWYAEILHAGDIVTRYCHLVRRPAVEVGEVVARGRIIGYVGTSGSSSGPHLHFEVHMNAPPVVSDNAVDPVSFMRAKGLQIG
jgi:murein DD-endopeptidase MepM/ murein hydrolase activator NlpD